MVYLVRFSNEVATRAMDRQYPELPNDCCECVSCVPKSNSDAKEAQSKSTCPLVVNEHTDTSSGGSSKVSSKLSLHLQVSLHLHSSSGFDLFLPCARNRWDEIDVEITKPIC